MICFLQPLIVNLYSSLSSVTTAGDNVKKTATMLRELNDELEEEKKKRFKLERYGVCQFIESKMIIFHRKD
jgi:hypothetical protein